MRTGIGDLTREREGLLSDLAGIPLLALARRTWCGTIGVHVQLAGAWYRFLLIRTRPVE